MLSKIFVIVIALAAIVIGVCFVALPRDQVSHLLVLRDFFDAAIPVLGFGALIKYLYSCGRCCSCNTRK